MRIYFLCLSFLSSISILAMPDDYERFVVNGIRYEVSFGKEASVIMSENSHYAGDLVIPDSVIFPSYGEPVSLGNGDYRFEYESKTVPVTKILGYAFGGCGELTSIVIPKTISYIAPNAFSDCIGLGSIVVDKDNEVYDSRENCNAIIVSKTNELLVACKNTKIPDNILSISGGIKDIKISYGLDREIAYGAFFGCTGLNSITIPQSVSYIGNGAFSGCVNIVDFYCYSETVPEGDAFKAGTYRTIDYSQKEFDFSFLNKATLHVHDVLIDEYKDAWPGFNSYKGLDNTDFKLTYYVDGEEYKCITHKYGEQIVVEEIPKKKGYTFSGWSEVPETMPSKDVTVTGTFSWSRLTKDKVIYEVSDTTQNYCKVVGNINASGEIKIGFVDIEGYRYKPTEVVDKAFYGCKDITKIEIPATLTSIGERAFANIDRLTDVTCLAEEVPTTDRTAFENSYVDLVTLHVPYGSIEKYKSSAPWNKFKEIFAIEGTQEETEGSEPITVDTPDTDITKLDNTLYIDKTEASVGGNALLSVKMKNAVKVEGFSFDLYLPDSVKVATDELEAPIVKLSLERTTAEKTSTFTASIQDDGALRVMAASTNGSEFSGNDGEVCTVQIEVQKKTAGDYPIVLKNIVISDVDAKSYEVEQVKSALTIIDYKTGDPNGDGIINVADYTAIAHYIMGKSPADFNEKAADVNTDGKVNVADYTGVTHLILYGQIARPASSAPRRAADVSQLDNVISIEPVESYAGEEIILSVRMKNNVEAEGFGFDMSLPDGMSYVTDTDGKPMTELSIERTTREKTNTFESVILGSTGALRMFAASTNGSSFEDNDGEVATITVKISEGMKPGTYSLVLTDIAISDRDAKSHNTDIVECPIIIEDATGINAVTVTNNNGKRYNLQGQQVTEAYKGVVIANGRKYLAR